MKFFRDLNQKAANLINTPAINSALILAARFLMSFIFIGAGYSKIGGYAGTAQFMQSMGVPGDLLPLVILLELGGGLALLAGFQTRVVSFALAVFCVVSGVIFHSGPEQMQQIMLMKNIAMAGGLLAFTVFGAGRLSLDAEPRSKE